MMKPKQDEISQDKADVSANPKSQNEATASMPVVIALLGYGGAIPFLALACADLLSLHLPFASPADLLIGYGAIILSFVGALGWGSHLRDKMISPAIYIWSIIPALMGWVALMAPIAAGALILIIGLVLCWWGDRARIKTGAWPKWMGRLRAHLTLLACFSLSVLVIA